MQQLIDEVKLRFEDMPHTERIYWVFFVCLTIFVSCIFKFFIFGVVLCIGIILGIFAFDNKEIPAIIISLFFAMLAFMFQFQNFNLEHRPYIGISDINANFIETGIDLEIFINNEGNYLARNLRINIIFEIPGQEINNPNNNESMGVVFSHAKYRIRKQLFLVPGDSKSIFIGKKRVIMKAVIKYDGLTTKDHSSTFECEYDANGKTFVFNKANLDN